MNSIPDILFLLTRVGLGGEAAWKWVGEKIDWGAVIKLAAAQGVLAIAWDGLQRLIANDQIPANELPSRDILLRWVANIDSIEKSYAKQKAAIRKLATFYNRNGFEMMLLKGYGLSLCYPTPEHRPCGDIDIWLYGRQQEADTLLSQKHGVKINEDKHHHTTFTVNGILVENHYNFLNINSHNSNMEFEQILRAVVDREPSTKIDIDGESVALPSPNFNALFLLRHSAGHFVTAETVLRHLCDWAVFVSRYGNEVDWVRINEIAKRFNLDRFLAISNRICVEYLGIDAAKFGGIVSDETAITQRVLADIIEPEFTRESPSGNVLRVVAFRARRWWAKRWKHRLVYNDSLVGIFFKRIVGYATNPKSIWK